MMWKNLLLVLIYWLIALLIMFTTNKIKFSHNIHKKTSK